MCCRVAAPAARIVRWGLTWQKSAEVIVPAGMKAGREGPGVSQKVSQMRIATAVELARTACASSPVAHRRSPS